MPNLAVLKSNLCALSLIGMGVLMSACRPNQPEALPLVTPPDAQIQNIKSQDIKTDKSNLSPQVKSVDLDIRQGGPAQVQPRPKKLHISESAHDGLNCQGVLKQGGAVLCHTKAGAKISVFGRNTLADKQGYAVLGFDRDAPLDVVITASLGDFKASQALVLEKGTYSISRIDGLPPSQVSSFSDEQLKRIKASTARKNKGFASRSAQLFFKDGFDYPLKDFVKTSPFGAQRILNGEARRPHYGVDIAAPKGTPIYAPADGVVSLSDTDLYFEGAMVLIDHGQGFISMYLHVDETLVSPGDIVTRGQLIATVGSRGRSTGPHLCWRLKWRNQNLDPELLTKWPAL